MMLWMINGGLMQFISFVMIGLLRFGIGCWNFLRYCKFFKVFLVFFINKVRCFLYFDLFVMEIVGIRIFLFFFCIVFINVIKKCDIKQLCFFFFFIKLLKLLVIISVVKINIFIDFLIIILQLILLDFQKFQFG